MKKQKYRTLKDELPRLVGAQYATGDQWRNNSRKNEEMEPKQKQHLVLDVTGGIGWWWPAAGLGALSVAVCAWDLLKELHYLHHLHHSLASGQTTGRVHSPIHQQKIGLKIYSTFTQSLPSGSFHKPLILIHQRADRIKPQSQKTNQSDYMDHSLV